MNVDVFNLELRKFLKRFGVGAQHAIEQAVQQAIADGKLTGREAVPVRATLSMPGLAPDFVIDGTIALEGDRPPRA
jgi:hypothetical protein